MRAHIHNCIALEQGRKAMSLMTEQTAVQNVGIGELGAMLLTGLDFTDGDVEESLATVIKKHLGKQTQVKAAVPEIKADEEKGIEGQTAQPAIMVEVKPGNSDAILGAIAKLPQLRGMFAEQIAEVIIEAREGDETYEKLLTSFKSALTRVENAKAAILEFDSKNAPGFDVESLLNWRPDDAPTPKNFSVVSSGRRGSRSASTVGWTLDEYIPKKPEVVGPNGSYHNVRLIRESAGASSWIVSTDEGAMGPYSSPHRAMVGTLEAVGLSTSRASTRFWNAEAQESEA